jgi:acetyl-CoA carboxylase carboxyl transferase subunit alpha
MKLTAQDLLERKIVDRIIPEVKEGLHHDEAYSFKILRDKLQKKIKELQKLSIDDLKTNRYQKYRVLGEYDE